MKKPLRTTTSGRAAICFAPIKSVETSRRLVSSNANALKPDGAAGPVLAKGVAGAALVYDVTKRVTVRRVFLYGVAARVGGQQDTVTAVGIGLLSEPMVLLLA
jgi:hypothetical protein